MMELLKLLKMALAGVGAANQMMVFYQNFEKTLNKIIEAVRNNSNNSKEEFTRMKEKLEEIQHEMNEMKQHITEEQRPVILNDNVPAIECEEVHSVIKIQFNREWEDFELGRINAHVEELEDMYTVEFPDFKTLGINKDDPSVMTIHMKDKVEVGEAYAFVCMIWAYVSECCKVDVTIEKVTLEETKDDEE